MRLSIFACHALNRAFARAGLLLEGALNPFLPAAAVALRTAPRTSLGMTLRAV
jgi:hypothetical protein